MRYWAVPLTFVGTFLTVMVLKLLGEDVPDCAGHPSCEED